MKRMKLFGLGCLALCLVWLAACADDGGETAVTPIPPTPTRSAVPTTASSASFADDPNFIVVATDAPNEPFTVFNPFGEVTGLLADMLASIAAAADLQYEFVVTPYAGALNSIGKDFDAVMSTSVIPDVPVDGVVYTDPYHQIGQVLVVLADERDLQNLTDVPPDMVVGVLAHSSGADAARAVLGISDANLHVYDDLTTAVEALVNEMIDGIVMDHYSAAQFTTTYPEQLKIVGGDGQDAWLSSKAYGLAVAAANEDLLARLNEAVAQVREGTAVTDAVTAWLVPDVTHIDVGESRVGTPDSELVIGMVGDLTDMDPAGAPGLIRWEVMQNTMSGLYRFTADNQLTPALALDFPTVSADGLVYTIRLRTGLRFPDGGEFTADDVKWSIDRASVVGSGSYLINTYLKDEDEDNFADADAVAVIDRYTVQITLQEPAGHFVSVLATPPYFPISNECFAEVFDPLSTCGGIGPYLITGWEPGDRMNLQVNPDWPGAAPVFANIQLRFYADADSLRRSLADFRSVDLAWTGLPYADYVSLQSTDADGDGRSDFTAWAGPDIFKSYLIFDQATAPWDSRKVREAAAYALDREALAQLFNGSRHPLYSPVPDTIPGHVDVFPERNLAQARALLLEVGYSQTQPLPITIWYLNDGRYTQLEEAYANAIKA
ncbi:MAG: transporter substrate-binding domain-containing protein, partial [Anaerolineales bacterium]|nr:transporter substrate-binding domain-containing protein [Anaerolineales bacterium]